MAHTHMTGSPVGNAAVRIGLTGHTDPGQPAPGRGGAAPVTARADPPPWVGVSCLGAGSDQLFAGLVLGLGGQLEVILSPATTGPAGSPPTTRSSSSDSWAPRPW